MKSIPMAVIAAATIAMSSAVYANGLGDDYSWQFRSPNERSVLIGAENLRQLKRGGYYNQWQVEQNFFCEAGSNCIQVGAGGVGSSTSSIGNYNETNTIISTDNSVTVGDVIGDNTGVNIDASGNSGASGNNASSKVIADQTNKDSKIGAGTNFINIDSVGEVTNPLNFGLFAR